MTLQSCNKSRIYNLIKSIVVSYRVTNGIIMMRAINHSEQQADEKIVS